MLKQNKKTLVFTSLLTLLPIPVGLLLWNRFPETMAVHWGITGEADGYASPNFSVFVLTFEFGGGAALVYDRAVGKALC